MVWSGLTCIRHCVRMCQRVCLLPCPASVKAVYIGYDGGGNSAQLSSSPRLHAEQWTEQLTGGDLHPLHASSPTVGKTRATGLASWDLCCYCRVRLFQLTMNTNQTLFQDRAPENCQPWVQTQKHIWPRAHKRREQRQAPETEVCGLFLSTLLQSAFIST